MPRLSLPQLAAHRWKCGARDQGPTAALRYGAAEIRTGEYLGPRQAAGRRSVRGAGRDRAIRFDHRRSRRPDGQRRRQRHSRHRGTRRGMNIDPITTEVVASRLRETAATMEHALYHSGYSPILRESKDGTAGLTDKAGRVVMLSGGIQFHYTAYEQSVQAVLARYPLENAAARRQLRLQRPLQVRHAARAGFLRDHARIPSRRAYRLRRQPRAQIGHRRHRAGLRRAPPRARSITMASSCPRCGSRPREGIEESVEAIIANNSRVPKSCSATCARRSARTRIGGAEARCAVRRIRARHRARGDAEPDRGERAPARDRAAALERRRRRSRGFSRS